MSDENVTSIRSLRQRPPPSTSDSRPKGRRSFKIEINEEPNIEDVYRQVHAKTNFNPTPLETIYESPKGKSQSLRDVMGVVKLKRHFRFTPFYNPSKFKTKMRKTKSKKLKRVGLNNSQDHVITLEHVEKALRDISEDENEENFESCNIELQKRENDMATIENELPSENIESISPMVVEMKDEEPVKVPERKMEDFLQFETNFDLSPNKQKIDKSKKNKRRSGRVQPLCLSNIFNDSSLEHIDKKICSDITTNDISKDDSVMQVDSSISNIGYETNKNFESSSKSYTQSKPKRRNSGIKKSIYRNNFVNSSPDSHTIFEEDTNSNPENYINKRLLSPTALLDQLSLCSPEPISKIRTKKSRRKSARLSFGGDNKPHFGSLWIDSKSPKNLNSTITASDNMTSSNFVTTTSSTSETMTNNSDPYKDYIENVTPFKSDAKDATASKIQAEVSDAKDFEFSDSPILTGIIDCKARLNQNRKFQVRKGSNIHVAHFVPSL